MSTLNHLMCIPFTDVGQKSGDRHQPTTQQSSHRNHVHNNDRHGSDRRGGGDNHRSNNNYSGVSVMGVTRETGVSSPTDLSILSSHRSHGHHNDRHGSDRRGGSDNHRGSNNNNYSSEIPAMDVTKETGVISPTELPILPGASGRVFAITEGQAANTS
nr:hypothetical protein [Tanacetum cinerariifolium]